MCLLKVRNVDCLNQQNVVVLGKRPMIEQDCDHVKFQKLELEQTIASIKTSKTNETQNDDIVQNEEEEIIDQEENKENIEEETQKEEVPKKIVLRGFLIAAAQRGSLDKIKLVMEDERYEVDIAEANMGCTPLHYACFYKHIDVVKYLVEHGAPIDAINAAGRTPIAWAVEQQAYDIVTYLLESEADPSITDKNNFVAPLHIAAKKNDYKMVELLLSINTETEQWTKVDAKTKDGYTAMSYAVQFGNFDMVALLYEYGAEPNIASNDSRITPLHRAVSRKHKEIVKYLLENNANINIKDSLGRTCLHLAAASGDLEIVQLILSFKPIVLIDNMGNSPSRIALAKEFTEIADLLSNYAVESSLYS